MAQKILLRHKIMSLAQSWRDFGRIAPQIGTV
jgi:hypothetical protein